MRKQWRDLGLWIFFGVVGGGAPLWCAIQIPYDFSMICAAAARGLCGGSCSLGFLVLGLGVLLLGLGKAGREKTNRSHQEDKLATE